MHEKEVADSIDALDGVSVSVVGAEEPGVLSLDEVARSLFGPELSRTVSKG